ncbi:MAG: hypothetical protein V4670_05920 [Bacteroidota bacterium]
MKDLKHYIVLSISTTFSVIGTYLLIQSFISPDTSIGQQELFKDRFINLSGIIFFGGGAVGYFLLKRQNTNNNTKTGIGILFSSLGFLLMGLALIIYPEEFRKGTLFYKYLIGYISFVFSLIGIIIALILILKRKQNPL